jgi:hypothetical protein
VGTPEQSPLELASTSRELWERLQTVGDLRPGDYDEELEAELRKALLLEGKADTAAELDAHGVSIERFVAAFFEAARPYVAMWSDLLQLFEQAAATTTTTNLQLEYDFGAHKPKIAFDLEHFRRTLEVAEQITARFDLTSDNLNQQLWHLAQAFPGPTFTPSGVSAVDQLADELASASRGAVWPEALPPRPPSSDPSLDPLLAEAWELVEHILQIVRRASPDHTSLMRIGFPGPDDPTDHSPVVRTIATVMSDHWISAMIQSIAGASKPATVIAPTLPQSESAHSQTLAEQLDRALAPLRNSNPQRSDTRQRLLEFLQLPIWEHRYELYSNWVCTRVIAALDDCAPVIHSHAGAIVFSFSGTHLATFETFRPRLHLWAELRIPATKLVSKHRKYAIKPDITLVEDPITAQHSPLVIECKQYKAPNNKSFGEAITDYAKTHTDATIILANYGPTNPSTVEKYITSEFQPRAVIIGKMRPDEQDQVRAFEKAVRRATNVYTPAIANNTGAITLTWGQEPRDLDLHLTLTPSIGETTQEVDYQSRGSLDKHPYCELDHDVTAGKGPETITIARWLDAEYTITVEKYAGAGSLATSDAKVTITHNGTSETFDCPHDLTGDTWSVATIDGLTGLVTPG